MNRFVLRACAHLGAAGRRSARLGPMAALAVAAALSACGGGGGDGPAPIAVTSTPRVEAASTGSDLHINNYTSLAAPTVRAVSSGGAGQLLALLAGAQREHAMAARTAPATGVAGLSLATGEPLRLAQAWASRALASGTTPADRAAAVTTDSAGCLSGTGTITTNDTNGNQEPDAGESMTATFSQCVMATNLPAISGTMQLNINQAAIDRNAQTAALDITVQYSALGSAGGTVTSGSARMVIDIAPGNTKARMSCVSNSVQFNGQTVGCKYDTYVVVSNNTITFEVTGGITVGGQTYAIERADAFVGAPPATGSLRMRDAAGDSVKLVARSATTFDLEFYPSGATTPAAVAAGLLWANFQE